MKRLVITLSALTAACTAAPPQTPVTPAEATKPTAAKTAPPPVLAPAPVPAQPAEPSAPPAPAAEPQLDCKRILREGIAHHEARRYDEAIQVYERGYRQCGHGHGFQQETGLSLAAKGKFDEAATHYLKEMSEPAPSVTTMGNCRAILGKLSAAKRAELSAFGATPEHPIHVPDIGYEYAWIESFACASGQGGKGKPAGQALITHEGQKLDALGFVCPDGSKGKRYFDFSADPTTKAMKKELGL